MRKSNWRRWTAWPAIRSTRARPTPTSRTWPARAPAGGARAGHAAVCDPQRADGGGDPRTARRPNGPTILNSSACMAWVAGLYRQLLQTPALARPVRIYAPVGTRPTLLAYLMRRLLENGAAASFVQRATQPATCRWRRLIADPAREAAALAARRIRASARRADLSPPSAAIPPGSTWPMRSSGLAAVAAQHAAAALIEVQPLVAAPRPSPASRRGERRIAARDPQSGRPTRTARQRARCQCRRVSMRRIGSRDRQCAAAWVADRNRAAGADSRARRAAVRAAAARTGGTGGARGGQDAAKRVGEVREAVDFLRYYAAQIRAQFKCATHRAARRRGVHQPMEFSAGDLHRPGGRGARRRQHRARQTCRAEQRHRRRAPCSLLHQAGRAARRAAAAARGR